MPVAWWQLALAFAAGAAAGMLYFGGLWLTVRRLPTARRPVLLSLGSFAVRTAAAVAIIFFAARDHWLLLVVSLVGLVAVRTVLVRILGPARDDEQASPEANANS